MAKRNFEAANRRSRAYQAQQAELANDRYAQEQVAALPGKRRPVEVKVSDDELQRMMTNYYANGGTVSTGRWSTTVPDPKAPAGIRLLEFRSREEADAAGFGWVGR